MIANQSGKKIVIWDLESLPEDKNVKTILCRPISQSANPNWIELDLFLEENLEGLRTEFFDLIGEISEKSIFGKSLIEYLRINQGISYWWVSTINEFANVTKSPEIMEIVKFLAIKRILSDDIGANIVVHTESKDFYKRLKNLFGNVYLAKSNEFRKNSKNLRAHVPAWMKKIRFVVRYYRERKFLIGIGLGDWRLDQSTIIFVTYSDNYLGDISKLESFRSAYWKNLPNQMLKEGFLSSFLHIYHYDEKFPTARDFSKALEIWNSQLENKNIHISLDTFLSRRLLVRTFLLSALINMKAQLARNLIFGPRPKDPVQALVANIWKQTFYGVGMLENMINEKLIEKAIKNTHSGAVCVYLQENQSWEKSLLYHWKKRIGNPIIGFPHTIFGAWDFRYFAPSLKKYPNYSVIFPDFIAVSNIQTGRYIQELGLPEHRLKPVEALRYFNLINGVERNQPRNEQHLEKRILILGDFSRKSTLHLLRLVSNARALSTKQILLNFKPHPNNSFSREELSPLRINLTNNDLVELIEDSDLVISTMLTSSGINAIFKNRVTLVYSGNNPINFSPIKSLGNVIDIKSIAQLIATFEVDAHEETGIPEIKEFFHLDSELPRWKTLFSDLVSHEN